MEKTVEIPEGYEARIESNKVILEPKENEDERVRKAIKMYVEDMPDTFGFAHGIVKEDMLAYLERQKENPQNANSIPADCASSAKCENEHNKPGDFVFELRQIISRHRYADLYGECVDDEEGMAREIMALCEQEKEQKPDCKYGCGLTDEQLMATEFWKEYLKECIIPGNKPTKADIDFLLPSARKYFSLVMKEACTICKEWSNGYQKGLEAAEQKPAEWSEEDEEMFAGIIADIKFTQRAHNHDVNQIVYEREIDWLESLRDNYKKCNSHWKPSDEQMAALLNAEGLVRANNYPENAEILASLYEDLKKL